MGEKLLVVSSPERAISSQKFTINSQLALTEISGNMESNNWNFGAGDPEFWLHKDELVVPGGRALDLGAGFGRSSFFFAMNGMEVDAYEADDEHRIILQESVADLPIKINTFNADVSLVNFTDNKYDTLILSQVFNHFPSKEAAMSVMKKGFRALKPGGYAYLRTIGTLASEFGEYTEASKYEYSGIKRLGTNCFEAPCGCSGEMRDEPVLFLDPLETMAFWEANGMKITEASVLPKKGQFNITYGADFNPYQDRGYGMIGGFITLIGRKAA